MRTGAAGTPQLKTERPIALRCSCSKSTARLLAKLYNLAGAFGIRSRAASHRFFRKYIPHSVRPLSIVSPFSIRHTKTIQRKRGDFRTGRLTLIFPASVG
jgi:hypothetical protein